MALTSDVSSSSLIRYAQTTTADLYPDHDFDAGRARVIDTEGRRARVVFINRYFYPDISATSQILFDLTQRLVEEGIEVHVVCSRQLYDNAAARLSSREVIHGIHVHRVAAACFGRDRLLGRTLDYASFYATGTAKLLSLLRRGDVVVAKTDPPLISIAAAAVAKLRGAHLVNWLQDVFPEVATYLGANPLPAWLDSALKRLRDRSLRMARMNVVLGSRMREHLEQRHIPGDQIRIIENWADGDLVAPIPTSASSLRADLKLTNKFVVAYSGNLGRAHEYQTILEASETMRSNSEIVFLMVGGGAKMCQLRQEVQARALPNFIFLPYQPREAVADALAAADVHLACLLPELEGLIVPSKFYGILAAGRPTVFIGDKDGEIARVVDEFRCGLVVQAGDSTALVRALWTLQHRTESRTSMGLRARQLFLQKYTVRRATEQWLTLLTEIDAVAVESNPPRSLAGC